MAPILKKEERKMTINLMTTTDDPRVVTKATNLVVSLEAKPTENCSVLNPQLLLNYSGSLINVNYMQIPQFGSYYFVDNITVSPGGQIVINGSIDVLKTYDFYIRSCTATVIRSESIGKPTSIPDSKLPIIPNKFSATSIKIANTVNMITPLLSNNYVLIVRG